MKIKKHIINRFFLVISVLVRTTLLGRLFTVYSYKNRGTEIRLNEPYVIPL